MATTMDNIDESTKKLFEKKIWSITDVESFTGYAKQTIYNLASLNEIPHIKKRNRLVFIPKEILNWMCTSEEK